MKDKLLAEWFWIDRWEGSSAAAMPLEARGLYREMLTRAWRLGGSLPADPADIQREVRCTDKEWKRAWPRVKGYWQPDPENPARLINLTQVDVIEDCRRRRDEASEHGRLAAQIKHARARARAVPEDMPEQIPELCPGTTSQSPVSGATDYSPATPAREGQPGELETLQTQVWAELRAAATETGLHADVILSRDSRAPNGATIDNPSNCRSVPWLRTTLQKLSQRRLSAQADRLDRPPPAKPTQAAQAREDAAVAEIRGGLLGREGIRQRNAAAKAGDGGRGPDRVGGGDGGSHRLLPGSGHDRSGS